MKKMKKIFYEYEFHFRFSLVIFGLLLYLLLIAPKISGSEKIEKFDEFERNNKAEWVFLWSPKDVSGKTTDELIGAAEEVQKYRLYLIDFFAKRAAELTVNGSDLYDGEKIKELNNIIFECSRMDKNIRTELKIRYYVQLKTKKENETSSKLAEKHQIN